MKMYLRILSSYKLSFFGGGGFGERNKIIIFFNCFVKYWFLKTHFTVHPRELDNRRELKTVAQSVTFYARSHICWTFFTCWPCCCHLNSDSNSDFWLLHLSKNVYLKNKKYKVHGSTAQYGANIIVILVCSTFICHTAYFERNDCSLIYFKAMLQVCDSYLHCHI